MAEQLYDLRGVAEYAGVSEGSARQYHYLAEKNRAAGTPKAGDLPKPDYRFGQSPVWRNSTLRRWIEKSPKRGAEVVSDSYDTDGGTQR